MIIRPETHQDIPLISEVIKNAFKNVPYSDQREAEIVDELRNLKDLTLSFVAEHNGNIIGHIAFSPVQVSGHFQNWYGLGPIATVPSEQNKGIGSVLIKHGLEELKKLNAEGCVLLGEPAFYSKFGFQNNPDLILDGVPAEYFLALSFTHNAPQGKVTYSPAFEVS
ncbi:MAG: N-acetyltransferase [Pseudomonadota bacterium]|nr:N-acetyltransferase [Pseudomonadota bacterium]